MIVAEDHPVNRELALAFLKRLGYQADWAGNGGELLERLDRGAYDVVFMDVQMPEMDGLEATRRIRRHLPPGRQPRIVAMTAAAFPEDRARCLEAGMDDYIAKPVDLMGLVEVLRRSAGPRRVGAGHARPAEFLHFSRYLRSSAHCIVGQTLSSVNLACTAEESSRIIFRISTRPTPSRSPSFNNPAIELSGSHGPPRSSVCPPTPRASLPARMILWSPWGGVGRGGGWPGT